MICNLHFHLLRRNCLLNHRQNCWQPTDKQQTESVKILWTSFDLPLKYPTDNKNNISKEFSKRNLLWINKYSSIQDNYLIIHQFNEGSTKENTQKLIVIDLPQKWYLNSWFRKMIFSMLSVHLYIIQFKLL